MAFTAQKASFDEAQDISIAISKSQLEQLAVEGVKYSELQMALEEQRVSYSVVCEQLKDLQQASTLQVEVMKAEKDSALEMLRQSFKKEARQVKEDYSVELDAKNQFIARLEEQIIEHEEHWDAEMSTHKDMEEMLSEAVLRRKSMEHHLRSEVEARSSLKGLYDTHISTSKVIETQLNEVTVDRNQKQHELASQLRDELVKLEKLQGKLQEQSEMIDKVKMELDDETSAKLRFEQQICDIRTETDAKIEKQLDLYKGITVALEEEKKASSIIKEQLASMSLQRAEAVAKFETLQSDHDNLVENFQADVSAKKDLIEQITVAKQELENQVSRAAEAIGEVKQKLQEQLQVNDKLCNDIKALVSDHEVVKAGLEANILTETKAREEVQRQANTLQASLESELELAMQNKSSIDASAEQKDERFEHLMQKFEEEVSKREKTQGQLEDVQEMLDDEVSSHEDTKVKLEELEEQLDEEIRTSGDLECFVEELKEHVAEEEAKVLELEKSLEEQNSVCEELQATITKQVNLRERADNTVKAEGEKFAELQLAFEQQKSLYVDVCNELAAEKNKLQEESKMAQEATERLNLEKEKHSHSKHEILRFTKQIELLSTLVKTEKSVRLDVEDILRHQQSTTDKNDHLEEEIGKIATDLDAVLKSIRREKKDMEAELEREAGKRKEVEERLRWIEVQKQEFLSLSMQEIKTRETLESHMRTANNLRLSLEHPEASKSQESQDIENSLKDMNSEIGNLQSELDQEVKRRKDAMALLMEARKEKENLESQLQEQQHNQVKEISKYAARALTVEELEAALIKETENATKANSTVVSLQEIRSQLESHLQQEKTSRVNLQIQVDDLTALLQDKERKMVDVQAHLGRQHNETQELLTKLSIKHKQSKEDLSKLQLDYKNLQSEREQLEAQLQQVNEEKIDLIRQRSEANEQLSDLSTRCKELEREFDAVTLKNNTAQDELEQFVDLSKKYRATQEQYTELTREYREKQDQFNEFSIKYEKSKKEINHLKQAVQKQRSDDVDLVSEYNETKQQLSDLFIQHEETKIELTELKLNLETARYQREQLQKELTQVNENSSNLEMAAMDHLTQIQKHQHEEEELEQKLKQKEQNEVDALNQLEEWEAMLKDHQNQIGHLSTENKLLTDERNKLSDELKGIRSEFEGIKSEFEASKSSMEINMKKENKHLKSKAIKLEKEISTLAKFNEQTIKDLEALSLSKSEGTYKLNHKQKIQLHLQIKQENVALKQRNTVLRLEIRKLEAELRRSSISNENSENNPPGNTTIRSKVGASNKKFRNASIKKSGPPSSKSVRPKSGRQSTARQSTGHRRGSSTGTPFAHKIELWQ